MMKKWQRAAAAAALVCAAVAGTAGVSAAVTGNPALTRSASTSTNDFDRVPGNIEVVKAFLQDVLNDHHGSHAGLYMTTNVSWSGGTVGTITGRENVAGLFAGVVSSLPNVHATVEDAFGAGNEVLVRLVVSGTQKGALLGIPATGRNVQWDALDVFRLSGGKIATIWAGDDWTAILDDTGTYKAPWIP